METPPGTISEDGHWRWDGRTWVSTAPQRQPQQPQQPAYGQQPYGQPGYGQPGHGQGYPQTPYGYAPQKPNHTVRNVLLVLAGVFVLFFGGCVALVGLAANEVDNVIEDIEANDQLPGGADNPLEIRAGQPFSVYGFDYQSGWSVGPDEFGEIEVLDLKFENNRDEPDSLLADLRFIRGNEVLATATCSSDQASVGQIVPVECYGIDPIPTDYDTITIQDSY